jgi:hypothetical protein
MTHPVNPLPIVVGIDGFKHAIRATIWAVDGAIGERHH